MAQEEVDLKRKLEEGERSGTLKHHLPMQVGLMRYGVENQPNVFCLIAFQYEHLQISVNIKALP